MSLTLHLNTTFCLYIMVTKTFLKCDLYYDLNIIVNYSVQKIRPQWHWFNQKYALYSRGECLPSTPEEVQHVCLDLAISHYNNVERGRIIEAYLHPRSMLLQRLIAKSRHTYTYMSYLLCLYTRPSECTYILPCSGKAIFKMASSTSEQRLPRSTGFDLRTLRKLSR